MYNIIIAGICWLTLSSICFTIGWVTGWALARNKYKNCSDYKKFKNYRNAFLVYEQLCTYLTIEAVLLYGSASNDPLKTIRKIVEEIHTERKRNETKNII